MRANAIFYIDHMKIGDRPGVAILYMQISSRKNKLSIQEFTLPSDPSHELFILRRR